jgi:hypothetical protein
MRLVINPHDDVSLRRVINVPARGIGKGVMERVEKVGDRAHRRQLPLLSAGCSRRCRPTRCGPHRARLEQRSFPEPGRGVARRISRSHRESHDMARRESVSIRDRQDAGSERLSAGPARRAQRGRRGPVSKTSRNSVSAARETKAGAEPALGGSSIGCRCSRMSTRNRASSTRASGS